MLLLCNSPLALSASVFSFSSKWKIDRANFPPVHHIKISLLMSLPLLDFVLPILRFFTVGGFAWGYRGLARLEEWPSIPNYLITESEVVTGKSQTEALR